MKKTLLFLSLIMCFAIVNAQNVNVEQFKKSSLSTEQTKKANPKQILKALKESNQVKTPIPTGYARVTMLVEDIWGDGTGVQMLIDSNATAYGTIIPTTGSYSDTTQASINAAIASYSQYEFKIPQNADGNLTTTNMLLNTTVSLDIPIGTYDYCIVNPTPTMTDPSTGTVYPGKIYMANGDAAIGDDFTFADGRAYTFYVGTYAQVYLLQENDITVYDIEAPASGTLTSTETISVSVGNIGGLEATNIPIVCKVNGTTLNATISSLATLADTVINFTFDLSTLGNYFIYAYSSYPNDADNANDTMFISTTCEPAASIAWNFNDGLLPADWRINNIDGLTPHNSNIFPNNEAWVILQMDETDYVAAATSWFEPAGQADRWLVTSRINLQGDNSLKFDVASYEEEYPESIEIKLSTGGTEPSDFSTLLQTLTDIPAAFNSQTIDLSNYTGTVRIAFRLISNDKSMGFIDNVKILGQALSLNEVENNVTFGVYPNPANDFLTISDANGAEVRILDMLGRTLITKSVKSSNETISIDNLNNGMYMIQIVKDGKTSTQKLIKK